MGLLPSENDKIEEELFLLKAENKMLKAFMGERKYPNVSIKVLEEVYRRFMKGDIMEKKLAYYTAKSVILDKLKLHFDDFLEKIKKDEII